MQATHGGTWKSVPLFANSFGLIAMFLALSVLTGTATGLIGDRAAFFALFVIGLAMCVTGGIGPSQAKLGWTHPVTVIGSAFGVVAVLLVGAVLFNWTTDRVAALTLATLMAVKWAIGLVFVR